MFHTLAAGGKSFLNATEDEEEETVQTIEFSTPKYGIKNYPENYAWQWFLIVPEGRQVQIPLTISNWNKAIIAKTTTWRSGKPTLMTH